MKPPFIKQYFDVLSPEICQEAIKKFTTDSKVTEDPQPDYSTRQYLNISKHSDWNKFTSKAVLASHQCATQYFEVEEALEDVTIHEWIDDGFILAHYRPGDGLVMHSDGQSSEAGNNGLRLVTVLFFLNSMEGGALDFPLQDVQISPKQGSAVVFPVHFTHPHQVFPVRSDRYVLQTWLTDPRYVVVDA